MELSLKTLLNIENASCFSINKYLKYKYNFKEKLNKNKIEEILSIYNFFKKNLSTEVLSKILKMCFSIELFKYEHDAMLFFHKKSKIIIFDIEIKKNSCQENVNKQIIDHIKFMSSRLDSKKYEIYGIAIVAAKGDNQIYKYNFKKNKCSKLKKTFNDVLISIFNKKFILTKNSLQIIRNMESDINDTINKCTNNEINFLKSEEKLIENIKSNIENYDCIIIDANGGVGKTTIILKLFFDDYKNVSDILFNNYRLESNISEKYKNELWFSNWYFKPIECENLNKNDIILIDEGQRLSYEQIINLKKTYKKMLIFGDKYQVFDKKFDCDFHLISNKLSNVKINTHYITYISDAHRRFSKDFPNFIKHVFNDKKYPLKKGKIKISEKIFIYDENEEFMNSYNNQTLHKKMFIEIENQRQIYQWDWLQKWKMKSLYGYNNPIFSIDDNYTDIGTAYNAFSFEIDTVYFILCSSLEEIKKNKYLFNEIYTICTRVKLELHILINNSNINDFSKIMSIINQSRIQYEK